eukprot:CAMPEP_0168620074 /NCGR_PEP_ID=MMETSP0449_2-20121227/6941_1 /TAXON_ID=1082188 /ORGANISM="Strombidium rassoulzadegani, Strain ras09" /LENGTH=117 /DNA_ID=CAMNT_0008661051 /DNA_START=294 /DNA_END=646 /DNA_ORIENTATION=-
MQNFRKEQSISRAFQARILGKQGGATLSPSARFGFLNMFKRGEVDGKQLTQAQKAALAAEVQRDQCSIQGARLPNLLGVFPGNVQTGRSAGLLQGKWGQVASHSPLPPDELLDDQFA